MDEDKRLNIPPYLCAAKVLTDKYAERELLEEACVLAQFDSPHIVRLVGCVTLGEPLLMVQEYCEHGSLLSQLVKDPYSHRQKMVIAGGKSRFLFCIAAGFFLMCVHESCLASRRIAGWVSGWGLILGQSFLKRICFITGHLFIYTCTTPSLYMRTMVASYRLCGRNCVSAQHAVCAS